MTAKSAILAQLVRVVASETSDQPLPVRLCLASSAILGADGAAITLCYTETTRLTVCATDEIAARLEDLQDVLGEGPGPDAYITGRMIRATLGERAARRWPAFAAAAHAELGPMAISAIPIQPGIDVLGVLTLYQLFPPDLWRRIRRWRSLWQTRWVLPCFATVGCRKTWGTGPGHRRPRCTRRPGWSSLSSGWALRMPWLS